MYTHQRHKLYNRYRLWSRNKHNGLYIDIREVKYFQQPKLYY